MESVKWQCKENGKSDKASVIRWVGAVKLYTKVFTRENREVNVLFT